MNGCLVCLSQYVKRILASILIVPHAIPGANTNKQTNNTRLGSPPCYLRGCIRTDVPRPSPSGEAACSAIPRQHSASWVPAVNPPPGKGKRWARCRRPWGPSSRQVPPSSPPSPSYKGGWKGCPLRSLPTSDPADGGDKNKRASALPLHPFLGAWGWGSCPCRVAGREGVGRWEKCTPWGACELRALRRQAVLSAGFPGMRPNGLAFSLLPSRAFVFI